MASAGAGRALDTGGIAATHVPAGRSRTWVEPTHAQAAAYASAAHPSVDSTVETPKESAAFNGFAYWKAPEPEFDLDSILRGAHTGGGGSGAVASNAAPPAPGDIDVVLKVGHQSHVWVASKHQSHCCLLLWLCPFPLPP